MKNRNLVSIIDDDESVRDSTKTLLRSLGYRVATFASAVTFLDAEAATETRCLILDIAMPDMSGLELQRILNASGSDMRVVFVSAHDTEPNRKQAFDAGAVGFLGKPFEADDLIAALQIAFSQ